MTALTWWMRLVGVLYLFMAVVSIGPRIPVRAEGPPGLLDRAAGGDRIAQFALDTWTMFGLYMGAVGITLLIASRDAVAASAMVWLVMALEFIGGIGIDIFKLARGYRRAAPSVWIGIHSVVIVTGWWALGRL